MIDESSFLSVCHSDISYDRTDDDVVTALTSPLMRMMMMMMSLVDEGGKSECVFVPGSGHERDQTSEVTSPREEGEQLPVGVMMSADAVRTH